MHTSRPTSPRAIPSLTLTLILTLLTLLACADPPQDEPAPIIWDSPDAPPDAPIDAPIDAPPDDPTPDVPADTADTAPGDTAADAPVDAAPDVAEDPALDPAPDATPPPPPRAEGRVFYEVFVRSFQDSDGDGIGDLRGLIDRLDYLNDGRDLEGDDLEVDGLWLMPIFPSPSYHGYDPTDYRSIAPSQGTLADLDDLLARCHERGMQVVLDLVVNHTSIQHPWFEDARTGPGAARRDFYLWRDADPGWTQPWGGGRTWHNLDGRFYYGLFWSGMPDLNYRNPAVADAMIDIGRFWVARGVDGFRIDAARYLVEADSGAQADQAETHAFFQRFRAELEAEQPRLLLVAESWADRPTVATYWGQGREFHQAFDFDLAAATAAALQQGRAAPLVDALGAITHVPWTFEATFLNNHDQDRLAARLPQPWQQRAAHAALLTLPGQPWLYYGDELAAEQGPQRGDEARRTPFAWTSAPGAGFTTAADPWTPLPASAAERNVQRAHNDPDSLLHLIRRLVRLRKVHPALHAGSLALVPNNRPALLTFLRLHADQTLLIAINLSANLLAPPPLDLSPWADALTDAPSSLLGPAVPPLTDPAAVSIGADLAPGEARIIRLRQR